MAPNLSQSMVTGTLPGTYIEIFAEGVGVWTSVEETEVRVLNVPPHNLLRVPVDLWIVDQSWRINHR